MGHRTWHVAIALCVLLVFQTVALTAAVDDPSEDTQEEETGDRQRRLTNENPPEPPARPTMPSGMEDLELLAFRLEYADEDAIGSLMEWAYGWVANDRGHKDGILRARDIPETLNPAEEDIEDDERIMLKAASDSLREEQGLHDDDMQVFIGFLSRGSPVRYARKLAHAMHHQSRARRLQAAASESERDL